MPDKCLTDILGPWVEPQWQSGLINRCRAAWGKPLNTLTNQELATLLRQKIATEHILPIAENRVEEDIDDDTEIYEGELKAAVERAKTFQ
jgi:hypothetical protein